MLCPSCAAENPSGNAYCGRCGTVLNEATAFVPHYNDQKRLVRRELAVVFGGVLGVLAIAWLAWYFLVNTRSPTTVVRAFIESDRSGQFTRQQELISNTWDSRAALTLFQAIRQQSGSSPFQNYRIVRASEGRSDRAFVDVELTVPPPTLPLLTPAPTTPRNSAVQNKIIVTFVLGRQGDDWKIDSTQTLASVISALAAKGLQQFQWTAPNFPNLPNIQLPPGWPNILGPPPLTPSPATPPATSGTSTPDGTGIL